MDLLYDAIPLTLAAEDEKDIGLYLDCAAGLIDELQQLAERRPDVTHVERAKRIDRLLGEIEATLAQARRLT